MSVIVSVAIPFGDSPHLSMFEVRNTLDKRYRDLSFDEVECRYEVTRIGRPDVVAEVWHRRSDGVHRLVAAAMAAVAEAS